MNEKHAQIPVIAFFVIVGAAILILGLIRPLGGMERVMVTLIGTVGIVGTLGRILFWRGQAKAKMRIRADEDVVR
jgi:hypothetical protein